MYAPVVLRFNTYRAQISDTARWYVATALEDAAAAGMGPGGAGRALDQCHKMPDSSIRTERRGEPNSPEGRASGHHYNAEPRLDRTIRSMPHRVSPRLAV